MLPEGKKLIVTPEVKFEDMQMYSKNPGEKPTLTGIVDYAAFVVDTARFGEWPQHRSL